MDYKKLYEQSQEELFGLRFDFDEKIQLEKENQKLKEQVEEKNKELKEQFVNNMISQQFYTDFLDPGEHAEAVQKEDIDEHCKEFHISDEKKQMLYDIYCYDSDEVCCSQFP